MSAKKRAALKKKKDLQTQKRYEKVRKAQDKALTAIWDIC
jgi:hypothetical protein